MQSTFMKILLVILCCYSCAAQEARWLACDPSTVGGFVIFSSSTGPNDPAGPALTPQICINYCVSSENPFSMFPPGYNDGFLTADTMRTYCSCGAGLPEESAITAETFLECTRICDGDEFAPCGNNMDSSIRAYYANGTADGSTMSINMCYNETTVTGRDACRIQRRATALFMGRLNLTSLTYKEIVFMDPCGDGNNGGCHANAMCSFNSSNGNRDCTCVAGFETNTTGDLVPGVECLDFDECGTAETNPCDPTGARCINRVGKDPDCECLTGFIDRSEGGMVGINCTPVFNECYFGTEPVCHALASCTNNPTPPGHTCTCPDGYTGDGFADGTGCEDINECDDNICSSIANADMNCQNTAGSYRCPCNSGFISGLDTNCVVPYAHEPCNPPYTDQRVAFGVNCEVAVLYDCSNAEGEVPAEPNRTRIVTDGSGMYATCVSNRFSNLNDYDPTTFPISSVDSAFINDNGESLLNAQVECTVDTFSIRFANLPVNAAGFNQSDLFLGGPGDYDTVAGMYKNDPNCQAQFWVQTGYEYRFGTTIGSSKQCGTVHSQTETQIMYSGVVRGRIGEVGDVVSRTKDFEVTFLCVANRDGKAGSPAPYLVFDLNRKKRGIRSVKQLDVGGVQHALTMDLWQDSSYTNVYQTSVGVQASQLVYAKIEVENLELDNNFEATPLRCWQTLTYDGSGDRYKNIVSNGCNQNQWKLLGNVRVTSNEDNSFRFGFPASSFNGGEENIYVSCLVDIGQANFASRCQNLLGAHSSFHADANMAVITAGPIRVIDVCGGRKRGGCEHYCSVTEEQTALCYCAAGFKIDPKDPRKCVLPSGEAPPLSSTIYWYYYGVPIIVLIVLVLVVGWVFHQNSKNSKRRGAYDLKFADRDEIIVD